VFLLGNATFACGVRRAREQSFEEASGEAGVGRRSLLPATGVQAGCANYTSLCMQAFVYILSLGHAVHVLRPYTSPKSQQNAGASTTTSADLTDRLHTRQLKLATLKCTLHSEQICCTGRRSVVLYDLDLDVFALSLGTRRTLWNVRITKRTEC